MKKISSAIFLAALLVFINCKNNAGDAAGKGNDDKDSVKTFYESIINLGNGFIDVFNAFSGLVADTFFKSDPKKSDVKTYFESISNTLTATKSKLDELVSAKKGEGDSGKASVKSAVDEVRAWLEEMIKAASDAAKVDNGGGGDKIGDVGANNNKGAVADENSVKGIAKGIKGIVDAAGKAFGGNALTGVAAAAGEDNADAGKLFAGQNGAVGAADAAAIAKAASAVTAVSGEQILKAIVDAAGGTAQAGVKADEAKNPIAAAIGTDADGAAFGNDMKKRNDRIAAAIVLRGVAKDGKFAVANNANDSKASVKSAVESAVQKTFSALTGVVRKAVEAGLKKVAEVVKKQKSEPGKAAGDTANQAGAAAGSSSS
ncbi:variable large family protein [Borreliella bavariensis]|uniref:variable large family protein n=1 Tax=Borreliella bavariensis TaxID=664662 RepID=UPI00165DA0DE|nr:variable large family protein [Borreliella bavariensis]